MPRSDHRDAEGEGDNPPPSQPESCFRPSSATARRREEPISAAVTESTVQWLLHRRVNAQQQMRWSPRPVHLLLKVRRAVMNGTLEHDYAVAETRACRPLPTRGMTPGSRRSPPAPGEVQINVHSPARQKTGTNQADGSCPQPRYNARAAGIEGISHSAADRSDGSDT